MENWRNIAYIFIYLFINLRALTCVPFPNNEQRTPMEYSKDLIPAEEFLKDYDLKATMLSRKDSEAFWDYETDLTDENLKKTVKASLDQSEFELQASANASKINTLDLPTGIARQIRIIRRNADSASKELRQSISETLGKMTSIFGKGKVCIDPHSKSTSKSCKKYERLEPGLTNTMKTSRNQDELLSTWKAWRDSVGPPTKALYEEAVDLINIGAREHGWIDYGDFWRSEYEMGDDFEENLKHVWMKIKPLYEELHAYVRFKLSKTYSIIEEGEPIPAHLLGDMYAQNWENIFDLIKPFPDAPNFDITNSLNNSNCTPVTILKSAENFFKSINLPAMPKSFWKKSVLESVPGKEMVCHASAWDFSSNDVRIKMCMKCTQEKYITAHHEMGHVEYFLAYQKQPFAFRNGANPGFHEAIGDTISLSVETPRYLSRIGLLKDFEMTEETTISFLLRQALRRVAPIPFNYLVDKWRWRVFEGNITDKGYNTEWWKLRTTYQGVSPPIKRQENDFDPAAKYHIGANVPYIAYFVSYILQFQFHRALCKAANSGRPLHECSIYNSSAAGEKFRKLLEAGRSKPAMKLLNEMTGERELDASAILEYFNPLKEWFRTYRALKGYKLGWKEVDLRERVLQRKEGIYESGQERSGILKSSGGGLSLSINLPSINLNGDPGQAESRSATNQTNNSTANTTPVLDLAKLLSSGNQLSITTTETNAINSDGTTRLSNREVEINTGAAPQGSNETIPDSTNSTNNTADNSTTSTNQTETNNSTVSPTSNSNNSSSNETLNTSDNSTPPSVSSSSENGTLTTANVTTGNSTNTTGVISDVPGTSRTQKDCLDGKRSYLADPDCLSTSQGASKKPKQATINVSPAVLVQHILENRMKNAVHDSMPQANVVQTPNGYTLNLNLNAKDRIPLKSGSEEFRQQHVNVYIAPKGVVVKPKSSVQLLKPSFVPVQNKDNLELRGNGSS